MGAEYAREKGFGFMEVSAKEDINIKSAFSTLTTNIFSVLVRQNQAQNPNPGLTVNGEPRAASISLHDNKNKPSNLKSVKKKDKGCCK